MGAVGVVEYGVVPAASSILTVSRGDVTAAFAAAISNTNSNHNHCLYSSQSCFQDTRSHRWPRSFAIATSRHRPSLLFPRASSSSSHHPQEQEQAAREAVQLYLHQEVRISREDALQITSNSPRYMAMLVQSVAELDQLPQECGAVSAFESSFTDKVYEMAKLKGDKGRLPYLESLGLTLSSASRLALFFHTLSLPTLISQVKSVKGIFFSDTDDEGLIGKNARRMMRCLSISVDEDLQRTLSFFDKIQARPGGLGSLGRGDVSFRHLIESFPRLLLLPIETHVKPMLEFLEDVGVPRSCLRKILLLFPPIMFYDIEKDLKPKLQGFKKVSADYNGFGRTLLEYPWIFSTSILENYENILHFFDDEKVPEGNVVLAIKNWPFLLGCSVNKLKLMVEKFGELDVRHKKLGRVIARSPQLLVQKPQEFLQVEFFFKSLGLDKESIGRIFARCPEIFAASIEKTLKRKLHFLLSIGVSPNNLPRVIRKYPEVFVCDVDRALIPRISYLVKIGLSKKDVGFMVRRFSPLLGYSVEKVLEPKLEFLVDIMKKPVSDVVEYPRYFSYSLEKKIKPRYRVLKDRNLECSLKEMLGKNDEEFVSEFMSGGTRV